MEVKGCDETCADDCTECEWEECEVLAEHGDTCDVRIVSDGTSHLPSPGWRMLHAPRACAAPTPNTLDAPGEVCKGVRRRHVRPARSDAEQPAKRMEVKGCNFYGRVEARAWGWKRPVGRLITPIIPSRGV